MRLRIDDADGHSVGSGTIIDTRSGEALVLTCGHIFRDSQGKGKITIDLSKVEANVKTKLDAKGITIFDKVPAAKALFQCASATRTSS